MTHTYIGPSTRWGLQTNTACRIVGRRAGGRVIRRADGKEFIVHRNSLRRLS